MNLSNNPRNLARIWTILILISLLCFFTITEWGFFKLDAIIVWLIACFAILVLSKNIGSGTLLIKNWGMIVLGAFLIVLSFINIPIGFGNPPYSIGDFTLLLSGISLVFFGFKGYRSFFFPVVLPAVAVIGFQIYDQLDTFFEWISRPLIAPLLSLTTLFVRLLHTEYTILANRITYYSLSGEPIVLVISSDCTGIWSLGTFTITCVIILLSFPQARTLGSYLLMLIGYLGTIASNIFRIWFIVFVGYYYGSYAAVRSAHDYFGWLVFSLWAIVFWYLFITRHLRIPIIRKTGKKE